MGGRARRFFEGEKEMKYWVYIDGKVPGSYAPEELWRLSGFSMATLVCSAEGEIQDKNWRHAGEFAEIARLASKQSYPPPAPPLARGVLTGALSPGESLESAEAKIFLHVKDLMGEVQEARRAQGLISSLQSQVGGLGRDLKQSLEEKASTEKKFEAMTKDVARLEKEERENKSRLESLSREKEEKLSTLKSEMERERTQSERLKTQLKEVFEDLAIRNGLVNCLAKDLSEKEKNLARSLEIIQRLEIEFKNLSSSNKTAAQPADIAPSSESDEPLESDAPLPSLEVPGSPMNGPSDQASKKTGFFFKSRGRASSSDLGASSSISLLQLKKIIKN